MERSQTIRRYIAAILTVMLVFAAMPIQVIAEKNDHTITVSSENGLIEKAAKPKAKLDLSLILNLANIALHALNRFRISLRIDQFRLRFIIASDDPYTTAMTYGHVQAAIGMLAPRIRSAFTVRESHVEMGTDFLASKPEIEARLVLTIRIGRIFGVLFATGFEFLRYMLKRKQQEAKAAKREKQVTPPVSDAAKPAQMSA